MASNDVSRTIGHMTDEDGVPLSVAVDCDGVYLKVGRCVAILAAGKREEFQRLFTEGERQAEAWAAAHGTEASHVG